MIFLHLLNWCDEVISGEILFELNIDAVLKARAVDTDLSGVLLYN